MDLSRICTTAEQYVKTVLEGKPHIAVGDIEALVSTARTDARNALQTVEPNDARLGTLFTYGTDPYFLKTLLERERLLSIAEYAGSIQPDSLEKEHMLSIEALQVHLRHFTVNELAQGAFYVTQQPIAQENSNREIVECVKEIKLLLAWAEAQSQYGVAVFDSSVLDFLWTWKYYEAHGVTYKGLPPSDICSRLERVARSYDGFNASKPERIAQFRRVIDTLQEQRELSARQLHQNSTRVHDAKKEAQHILTQCRALSLVTIACADKAPKGLIASVADCVVIDDTHMNKYFMSKPYVIHDRCELLHENQKKCDICTVSNGCAGGIGQEQAEHLGYRFAGRDLKDAARWLAETLRNDDPAALRVRKIVELMRRRWSGELGDGFRDACDEERYPPLVIPVLKKAAMNEETLPVYAASTA